MKIALTHSQFAFTLLCPTNLITRILELSDNWGIFNLVKYFTFYSNSDAHEKQADRVQVGHRAATLSERNRARTEPILIIAFFKYCNK